jgi:muconate cycloisomerase
MIKTTIGRIETFPVNYPTVGWFKFLEGPKGRPAGRASVVIKITADNGAVGWGQSVPAHRWSYETLETVQTTIASYLAPELIGLDPFDENAVRSAMDRSLPVVFHRATDAKRALTWRCLI